MLAIISVLIAVATAHSETSGTQDIYGVEAVTRSSAHYTGSGYVLSFDHKFENQDLITVNGHRNDRHFTGGPTLVDFGGTLGHVHKFAEGYWENLAEVNPNASFSARWAAATTPHRQVGEYDLGLNLGARRYENLFAGTVSPRAVREFRRFTVSASAYVTRTYDYVVAYAGTVITKPFETHVFRVGYSAGRSIEDQGIETRYGELSIAYGIRCSPRWEVTGNATFFRGDIRREDAFGLKLEFIP